MKSILLLSLFSFMAVAKDKKADITGDTLLGDPGKKIEISLAKEKCSIVSVGEKVKTGMKPKEFRLEFNCGGTTQVIWDVTQPQKDDFPYDDPRFELLWAGDKDNDGKIDIQMELSPRYSCSKKITFLSSLAKAGEIVHAREFPKTICADI